MRSANTTAKVLVLMPPPVEELDAPMNIKMVRRNSMGVPMAPMSTVLKPLVRVALWKKEVVMRPVQPMPSRVPPLPDSSAR